MDVVARGTRAAVDAEEAVRATGRRPVQVAPDGAPAARAGVLGPANLVGLQRAAGNGAVNGLVAQRTMADYTRGYNDGYEESFYTGLSDGLTELVEDGVITKVSARDIPGTHRFAVQYPAGWATYFEPRANALDHVQEGWSAGAGAGFDQGYEEAIAGYGYSRKYQAIPALNKQLAMADNGGTCVYCDQAPTADVDHIEPLKEHWRAKGATMDVITRSVEASAMNNLVGACAACNRSKGAKKLVSGWAPPRWPPGVWWPFGPPRVKAQNRPPPYW